MANEYIRPQEQYREDVLLGENPGIQGEWNAILQYFQQQSRNPNLRTALDLQVFYNQLLTILLQFLRRYPQIDLNRVSALLKFPTQIEM